MAEATHATTETADAHATTFPPFETQTFAAQILWLAISFGLLYYLMSKIALPRLASVLHERAQRIARDLAEAQAMKKRAEEAGEAYERSLAEARSRAKVIAQEARDALSAEADSARKALEADLAGRLAAADAAIKERTEAAMASVRGIATEAAGAIVERLTGRAPDGTAVQAAYDRTVRA